MENSLIQRKIMNEIKCPNCGEVFTVNESQYAELISQVRTVEFDKELHERMKQELALAEQKAMNEQQTKLAQKDQKIDPASKSNSEL